MSGHISYGVTVKSELILKSKKRNLRLCSDPEIYFRSTVQFQWVILLGTDKALRFSLVVCIAVVKSVYCALLVYAECLDSLNKSGPWSSLSSIRKSPVASNSGHCCHPFLIAFYDKQELPSVHSDSLVRPKSANIVCAYIIRMKSRRQDNAKNKTIDRNTVPGYPFSFKRHSLLSFCRYTNSEWFYFVTSCSIKIKINIIRAIHSV